ncbi:MAG: hypothetical protein ACK5CE_03690 [Actinomycetes bacterium]|jgi:hypothetical protein|uniref:Unannotated protein n=1 Tax=freshwater metagenome TaxID=449393 RepID=A0A6J6GPJ3_9ZZZZ|nr:hypothetical protein [Actinomycetota bacterium]
MGSLDSGSRARRTRRLVIAVGTLLASGAIVVVAHDSYQAFAFQEHGRLCRRTDGSFWRDPSNGCTAGNDLRCAGEPSCDDSEIISEGWRRACTWFLFDSEVPPTGDPPFYEGEYPGRGCLGRR